MKAFDSLSGDGPAGESPTDQTVISDFTAEARSVLTKQSRGVCRRGRILVFSNHQPLQQQENLIELS